MGRGIEVHDGYITFPENVMPKLHIGTEASPMTQIEAGQVVVSAVINAIALGGDVRAGQFQINASVDLAGNPIVLSAQMTVNDGITVTGNIRAGHIGISVGDGSTMVGRVDGLYVNLYTHANSVIDNLYGIHISGYNVTTTLGTYYHMRLTENGSVTVDAAFYVTAGGTSDMTNLFLLANACTAWSATLNPPGAGPPAGGSGRIAINIGGLQRYIQLFV